MTSKKAKDKRIIAVEHRGVFWEARSRILLWYVGLMLGFIGLSVPIFSYLVYSQVETRVREDLEQDLEKFEIFLEEYSTQFSNDPDEEQLKRLFKDFLSQTIPEDDTFLITIINNQFYRSSPRALPDQITTGSNFMKYWSNFNEENNNSENMIDASVYGAIYEAKPIIFNNKVRGIFVATHIAQGEKEEAGEVINLVVQVLLVGLAIAIILAWIASAKILTPLKSLANATSKIGESDLNKRITVEGTGEIAELAIAFNGMMNRLQYAFDSQRNFLNDAGHELRTPITIIQGHLELMGDDPQDQQETLTLVFDELDRMNRLVSDLTLLAKSERSDFLQWEMIDIAALTEELYTKSTGLVSREWKLEKKANGQILGDRQRLTQAFMNLAQNATHYTNETDKIIIGSAQVNNTIHLWIKDTGRGIDIEDQKHIFRRFYRGKIHHKSEGTGLGLSIAQAIVEAHHGWIELFSQVEKGATFTMILPITNIKNKNIST